MKDFLNFVREQGIVGLAVGFILGGAVKQLVTSFINDLITPLLGVLLGFTGGFKDAFIQIGPAKLLYGNFLSTLIDFLVVAAVVYFGVKALHLDKIDKKKA
ncbi:hypothetical protein A3K55_00065 [Candidatus Shapirobacteria bacterium RBG_13_44_7]|uniref:Mechanosensitive ion channel protein MscL n=1 Tax=Candidatus Shapirobacteria bacterium RBG_13_44_7 TaxID=1802149 RepID=A0A1F7SEI5_9BACT|nr:MAG: hypothetical protein A3K55_00065 [Candidatus Shapirobacteria bacterium RBG_13_44_7]